MNRDKGWDLGVLAVAKAALSFGVLARGFVALSDDDFSRIVIAEGFAHAPSLDPSKTSWLPLPFWIQGSVMMLLGRTIATAHATALVLGVVSALLIHRAALWLGASRGGAVLSAFLATSVPTAARLGVSAQPEALAAGLVVLGAAATRVDGTRRFLGAAALFAACLCRYEAWAAAALFAALALYDAVRMPHANDGFRRVLTSGFAPRDPGAPASERPPMRAANVSAALVALAAPLVWLVHGATAHGDALFFLHRVAAYRRALGITEPVGASLLAYPALLVKSEPELTLGAIAMIRIAADRAPRALAALLRPALVLAGLFLFLVVGRVLDGAPTHHEERTLLPVWTLLSMVVGEGLARVVAPVPETSRGEKIAGMVPILLGVVAISAVCRLRFPGEPPQSRASEMTMGYWARLLVGPGERVLIDTKDYGYFAIIAAFGAPERAAPIDRHDPRERSADAFASEAALAERLRSDGARWLVVRREHLPLAHGLGTKVATEGTLTLLLASVR